jgi:NAD(P)H-dependent FMN reductase
MPPEPLRILAVSGSLRARSYTCMALEIAMRGAADAGAATEVYDLREHPLPFCDAREAEDTLPPEVHVLRAKALAAHGLLVGTPEYHGSYSGVIKNALDLLSFDELGGKMVGLVAVSGGASGASALSHLRLVMRAVHAWVVPQQVMVPYASKAFDEQGRARDPALEKRLLDLGREVVKFARIHAAAEPPPA